MFARIGRVVVRHPWWTIGAWVVVAAAIIALAPGLSRSSDQARFLPDEYESVQASAQEEQAFKGEAAGRSTAIFVVERTDLAPLTDTDQQTVQRLATQLSDLHVPGVVSVRAGPATVAQNKCVQLIQVSFAGAQADSTTGEAGRDLRDRIKPMLDGTGLTAGMTGEVGIAIDGEDAFSSAEQIVAIATVLLIIALQLLVFRSPIAAMLPMVSVGLLLVVSLGLIGTAQEFFNLQADQSILVWVTVVLFGVGTDYILFLLFRYRERLRAGDEPKEALVTAVAQVGKVITSAGAAIVIAFSSLTFSSFGSLKSQGPGLAIAVALTVIAALTLVPAVVSLLGTKVFWPSRSWRAEPRARIIPRISALVSRRSGVLAALVTVLMGVLALGALRFEPSYDFNAGLPQDTESAKALDSLERGFPIGVLNPTTVLLVSDGGPLDEAAVTTFADGLSRVDGVGQVTPAQFSPDRGAARISVLLDARSGSPRALDTVADDLRPAAHDSAPPGTTVLIGGSSATFADVRSAVTGDYLLVFPLAAALTAMVLVMLLRSLVAPLLLMIAVGLSYLTTLGVSVLVLQDGMGREGLIFNVPIFMYLFVVAIGTDYNILMVDRLRDEIRAGHPPREAGRLAIWHAAPTAAAAAVILAGTFASLLLSGVGLLAELGFAVAAGIIISAFAMSCLLVPALAVLIGRAFWWPGRQVAPVAPDGAPAPASPDPEPATPQSVGEGR
ncbi:MMPL family transporter [Plantactinospora veratri]